MADKPNVYSKVKRIAFADTETSGLVSGLTTGRTQLLEIAAQTVDADKTGTVLDSFNAFIRPTPEAFFREGTDIEHLRKIGALEKYSTLSNDVKRTLQGALHSKAEENLQVDDKALKRWFPAPGEKTDLVSLAEAREQFHAFLHRNEVDVIATHNAKAFDQPVLAHFNIAKEHSFFDTLPWFRDRLGIQKGESAKLEHIAHAADVLEKGKGLLHGAMPDTDVLRKSFTEASHSEGAKRIKKNLLSMRSGEAHVLQDAAANLERKSPKFSKVFEEFQKSIGRLSPEGKKPLAGLIEHANKSPLLAIGVGLGIGWLASKLVSPNWKIPAKDDAYNTITGMDEGGTAAQFRKINTDFGSGYRGPVGSVKVAGQFIDPAIQGFRAKWFGDFSNPNLEKSMKERIKASSEEYDQFRPDEIEAGPTPGTVSVNLHKFNTRWDDADTLLLRRKGVIQAMFAQDIAIRLTGIDSPETKHPHDPTEWFRFRQEQPYGSEATEIAKQLAPSPGKLVMDPKASTYGRYVGLIYNNGDDTSINQRLLEEGAAAHLPFGEAGADIYSRRAFQKSEDEASAAGRGLWADPFFQSYKDVTKSMGGRITFNTLTDLSRLSKNYNLAAAQQMMWSAHEQGSYDPDLARSIGRKLKPSMGRFFGKKPKLSAKDDDHNTIEAMGHSGIAGELRKKNTDFGSGFDALKALFRGEKQLAEITAMSGFKEAIRGGKVLKRLGDESKFGIAELMSTTIAGKEFKYVRKRALDPNNISHVNALKNEAHALNLLHEGPLTPSPYLQEGHELYMEHMPGKTLKDLGREKGMPREFLGEEHGQQLLDQINELSKHGFVNEDIHSENLLFDPETNRLSWIDFGLTNHLNATKQVSSSIERAGAQMTLEARSKLTSSSAKLLGKTPALKQQMAARQRDANITSSYSAEFGGKGHTVHGNKSK